VNRTKAVREVLLALGLVAFGLIVLPALVYLVGQRVVGEYPDGLGSLYAALGDALIAGNVFAWVLVFSPYLSVVLIRLFLALRAPRQTVN
jgi:hypothetical protein